MSLAYLNFTFDCKQRLDQIETYHRRTAIGSTTSSPRSTTYLLLGVPWRAGSVVVLPVDRMGQGLSCSPKPWEEIDRAALVQYDARKAAVLSLLKAPLLP